MSELILILGGARAGKSTAALELARATSAKVCFMATAQALDDDMQRRIERHRAERPADWQTIEEPYDIDVAMQEASPDAVVVVDCLTLFVSNWLMRHENEHECQQHLEEVTKRFLDHAHSRSQPIICVSNEVGLGVVPETQLGRVYRDLLGRVNQNFAAAADQVYLMVAGIKFQIKPSTQ